MSSSSASRSQLLDGISEEQLARAVDEFYDRLVSDPALRSFFDDVQIEALKFHQMNIVSMALSEEIPDSMDVAQIVIEKRHGELFRKHGLSEYHFDLAMRHLRETLESLEFVKPDAVDRAVSTLLPLRPVFQRAAARQRLRKRLALAVAAAVLAVVGNVLWQRRSRDSGSSSLSHPAAA